ncbi:B12-binding domain-containing protein [Aestuariivirga sp.]|uniref:cobalamin B12-binding domain-containing protein n=1 Tax=Aestuariivirga sp. TaxID=2650926 RepID=UPI0039E4DC86
MSNDLQWTPLQHHDQAMERLKPFTEPLSPAVAAPTESHLEEFASVIENIIVPRLLMSHVHNANRITLKRARLDGEGVKDFIELTMDEEPDAAIGFVQGLLDNGVAFQDVLLKLMAPAARELGERWAHDSTNFVEVTLGVARMHRILREFDGVPEHMWSQVGAGRSVLLMPVPGEQHTFGLRLVQEFLLRESWSVITRSVPKVADIHKIVAKGEFDVIGLSLSGETLIDSLRSSIAEIRDITKSSGTKILIGGQLFSERPDLVESLGADAYAPDAPSTVTLLNRWAYEAAAPR